MATAYTATHTTPPLPINTPSLSPSLLTFGTGSHTRLFLTLPAEAHNTAPLIVTQGKKGKREREGEKEGTREAVGDVVGGTEVEKEVEKEGEEVEGEKEVEEGVELMVTPIQGMTGAEEEEEEEVVFEVEKEVVLEVVSETVNNIVTPFHTISISFFNFIECSRNEVVFEVEVEREAEKIVTVLRYN